MAPGLLHGSYVVVTRWFIDPKEGDVVMIRHRGKEKIKRITGFKKNQIFVSGDNRFKSTDSKDFGWIERETIVAKLLWPRA